MEAEKCQGCRGLDYDSYETPKDMSNTKGPRRWLTTFDGLRSGSVAGCDNCRAILEGARWAWGEHPEVVGAESRHRHPEGCDGGRDSCPDNGVYDLKLDIRPGRRLIAWRQHRITGRDCFDYRLPGGLRPSPDSVDAIEFYTPEGLEQLDLAFGFAPEVPLTLDVERLVSVVKPWLHECDDLHSSCQEPSGFLPKRLIDITDAPRLVDSGLVQLDRNTKYATLSHRWGSEEDAHTMPKTLSTNIQARMESISWEEFPPAFRDAIEVVRALGCHFIWIDSFCIVQDDKEDWRTQSVLMSQVYSSGYLSLATSALDNSHGRLLRDRFCYIGPTRRRTPASMDSYTISGHRDNDCVVSVRRSFDRQHHDLYGLRLWTEEIRGHPLLERAWVFQERLLSRRTIHIGVSEVMWECRHRYHCECGSIAPSNGGQSIPASPKDWIAEDFSNVTGDSHSDTLRAQRRAHVKKALFSKACSPGAVTKSALDFWMQAVEEYSELRLTRESDRLIALAGIARKMQKATGFTYLAGLWLEDLPRSLCWSGASTISPTGEESPPKTTTNPSWSWASVAEPQHILWREFADNIFQSDSRLQIDATDTFCQHVNNSPFGEVISAQIKMSAAYVRGTLTKTGKGGSHLYVDVGHLRYRLEKEHTYWDLDPKRWTPGLKVNISEPVNSIDGSWDHLAGVDAFCLLLGRDTGRTPERGDPWLEDRVLVVRGHPNEPERYVRFGVVQAGPSVYQGSDGEEDFQLISPRNLEELYRDAEVKEFVLV